MYLMPPRNGSCATPSPTSTSHPKKGRNKKKTAVPEHAAPNDQYMVVWPSVAQPQRSRAQGAHLTIVETQVRVAPERMVWILGEVAINGLELVSHVIEASHERIMPGTAAATAAIQESARAPRRRADKKSNPNALAVSTPTLETRPSLPNPPLGTHLFCFTSLNREAASRADSLALSKSSALARCLSDTSSKRSVAWDKRDPSTEI